MNILTEKNYNIGFYKIVFVMSFVLVATQNAHASDLSGTLNTGGALNTGLTATVAPSTPTTPAVSSGGGGSSGGSSRSSIPIVDNTVKSTPSTTVAPVIMFTRPLKVGSTGIDVKSLQKFLNGNGYVIAKNGPGSPGNETNTFGGLTKNSLLAFQKKEKIKQTGILDPATITVIMSIVTKTNNINPVNIPTPTTVSFVMYTRDLYKGDSGLDVKQLQIYLNKSGYIVALVGAGSPGKETSTFGEATKKALIKFQIDHGIPATGNFGPKTRASIK